MMLRTQLLSYVWFGPPRLLFCFFLSVGHHVDRASRRARGEVGAGVFFAAPVWKMDDRDGDLRQRHELGPGGDGGVEMLGERRLGHLVSMAVSLRHALLLGGGPAAAALSRGDDGGHF